MASALTPRSRRCYHRVMSGLERGGQFRFITLTSSAESSDDIQRSWRALQMRMKRRNLYQGYIRVREQTKKGRYHLHILVRGPYIPQQLLSKWWGEIHQAPVVDIRSFGGYGGKKGVASYMAKYMSKEGAGRYSWSWGWVWRGFAGHWKAYKTYWAHWFEKAGRNTFHECLIGWQMWLRGVLQVDIENMLLDLPPPFVLSYASEAQAGPLSANPS